MRGGKGIAFLVGIAAAGLASALLVGEEKAGRGRNLSSDPTTERSPDRTPAMQVPMPFAIKREQGPMGDLELASLDLFEALATADWERSEALLLDEGSRDELARELGAEPGQTMVETCRLAFEGMALELGRHSRLRFLRVDLAEPPMLRGGHLMAEDFDWIVLLNDSAFAVRSPAAVRVEDEWRFLWLPEVDDLLPTLLLSSMDDPLTLLCDQGAVDLESALRGWAEATGAAAGAGVSPEDVVPHATLRGALPVCPRGGQWESDAGPGVLTVGEPVRCSVCGP